MNNHIFPPTYQKIIFLPPPQKKLKTYAPKVNSNLTQCLLSGNDTLHSESKKAILAQCLYSGYDDP